MKCAVIVLSLAALCCAAPKSTKKTEKTDEIKPKQISTPWFSTTATDGTTQFTSPWFSSVTNAEGSKQIVTPWFSSSLDGTKQITVPFFSAEISNPADPFLPSTFKFKTPFSTLPADINAIEQPSTLQQVLEQANTQQQADIQQLVSLVGVENTEVLLNALIGHYSQVTPLQYQNLQLALHQVGQPNVQELLNSFAGEKFKFTSQYEKESVKLPATVVLDRVLEQLRQQFLEDVTQGQYQEQYPMGQRPYGTVPVPYTQGQVLPYQYAEQQGAYGQQQSSYEQQGAYGQQLGVYGQQKDIYGQQRQYPNQYAPQYQYGSQIRQQGQYYQPQSTLRDYYYPLTHDYQQSQYSPYQQHTAGFKEYQPSLDLLY